MKIFLSIKDPRWESCPAGIFCKRVGAFLITFHLIFTLNLMRTLIVFLFLLFSSLGSQTYAQCSSGNTYSSITVPCGSPCIPLSFTALDIRGTSNYISLVHPYTPFPFEDRGQPAVIFGPPAAWPGNSYSGKYNLPFSFCFFDSVYDWLVIGSNGCVSFDSSMAYQRCDPRLINTISQRPLPLPSGLYYARALIAAVMQDLDPLDTARVVTGEKVEYRIEGTAPCRKIVISYNKIPLWPGLTASCQTSINTYQMVLHEGTGIIDVYEKDKPPCSGSNSGRAILGIQNWNRDYAVPARGDRNDSVWGGNNINESFRFLPFGGSSRFIRADLTDGIHLIATTTTATPAAQPGDLTVQFSSVCPPANANFFILKTVYSACTGTGTVEYSDTILVNHSTNLNATAQTIPPACGGSNGSIIVHVAPGGGLPVYQFSLNGGPLQTDSLFSGLGAGTYNIHAQDAGGCFINFPVNLVGGNVLYVNTIVDSPSCTIATDGNITVNVLNGNAPFSYTINGGAPQTTNVFSGLAPGNYVIEAYDATGCRTGNLNVTVPQGPALAATVQVTPTSCSGANNGTITVTPTNGSAPYSYSINGGPFQSSNLFPNLSVGSYTINVIDGSGCTVNNIPAQIIAGPSLVATVQTTPTSCSGANNGTITVIPRNGTAPYSYSLNGGPSQSSNLFTNLSVGNYTIKVTDANGCTTNNLPAQILAGQPLTASATHTDASCNGGSDGTITVTPGNGTAPYQYSIDGINFQSGNVFNGIAAGNYVLYVKDNNGCSGTTTAIVSQPAAVAFSTSAQNVKCYGDANGTITVTTIGGAAPYQYSLNGTSYQASNIFNGLIAGSYTLYVKDSKGCTTNTQSININQPQLLQVNTTTQNASCGGGNDGKINVTASGGNNNYTYSIDGINFQPSNVFSVAPGIYTVTVKDVLGCVALQSNITVGLSNTLAIRAIPDTNLCLGRSISLNALSNATQYNWTPTTGLSSTTIANPSANPTSTTTYIVSAVLGPCQGSDTVVVTVLPAPVADAGNDGRICLNDSTQLNGAGGINYQWTPATGLSNATTKNPFAKPRQTTSYNLLVTDANGCVSLVPDVVTITVIPPPLVNITPDTYVSPGQTIQLHAQGGVNYLWSPPTDLNNPAIPDPIATITQDITYTVVVTTPDGCKAKDSVTIKAYKGPDIYVPTGFTPNHDGKNDLLTPIAVGIKELEYFKVYNRWGQLVFSTNQLRQGWNGKLGIIDQVSGVYAWIVKGLTDDGKVIFKKGTVILIR